MRITNLTNSRSMIYSSNVYLVLGDWSTLDDVNTLIDVGNDPAVAERIKYIPTGLGKRPIEQVILTHSHFDHAALLPIIRDRFAPVIYAHSPFVGADVVVHDGQRLRCGDRSFEVIHTPGHSDDSICLYGETDGVLFVGDTPVIIRSPDDTHEDRFVAALEQLCRLDVRAIYFGHGDPLLTGVQTALHTSLCNVRLARGENHWS